MSVDIPNFLHCCLSDQWDNSLNMLGVTGIVREMQGCLNDIQYLSITIDHSKGWLCLRFCIPVNHVVVEHCSEPKLWRPELSWMLNIVKVVSCRPFNLYFKLKIRTQYWYLYMMIGQNCKFLKHYLMYSTALRLIVSFSSTNIASTMFSGCAQYALSCRTLSTVSLDPTERSLDNFITL